MGSFPLKHTRAKASATLANKLPPSKTWFTSENGRRGEGLNSGVTSVHTHALLMFHATGMDLLRLRANSAELDICTAYFHEVASYWTATLVCERFLAIGLGRRVDIQVSCISLKTL